MVVTKNRGDNHYLENACGGENRLNRASEQFSAELLVPLICDLALLRDRVCDLRGTAF